MPFGMSRDEYARRYGPTTGDRVRLADSDLWVEVEDDHVGYGDEPLWGYGKNIRSRMTQSDRATADSELDVLVAGVLLIDPFLGVVKTNIGYQGRPRRGHRSGRRIADIALGDWSNNDRPEHAAH